MVDLVEVEVGDAVAVGEDLVLEAVVVVEEEGKGSKLHHSSPSQ